MGYCNCYRMCPNCHKEIEDRLIQIEERQLAILATLYGLDYDGKGKLTILP